MYNPFIVNEIQLSYKRHTVSSALPKITGARSAYDILLNEWDQNRIELVEDFKMLLLTKQNKVLGIYHVSSGTTAAALVDPKLIFVAALKTNAASIILAHNNHPSGNLNPSEHDRLVTDRIIKGGELLEIKVHDHLILSNEGFYSFAEGIQFNL